MNKYIFLIVLVSASIGVGHAAAPQKESFFSSYIDRWNLPHKVVGITGVIGGSVGAFKLVKKACAHRQKLKKVNAALARKPTDGNLLKKKAFHKKWVLLNTLFATFLGGGVGFSGWLLGDAIYNDWLFANDGERFYEKFDACCDKSVSQSEALRRKIKELEDRSLQNNNRQNAFQCLLNRSYAPVAGYDDLPTWDRLLNYLRTLIQSGVVNF